MVKHDLEQIAYELSTRSSYQHFHHLVIAISELFTVIIWFLYSVFYHNFVFCLHGMYEGFVLCNLSLSNLNKDL